MKKANYKKKKETIKKKTRELSILCGIKACAILVGPNGEVDTWPENPTELNPIIQSYKECIVGGKRKVKVEDVIDGGCLKKKLRNNIARFCDNGDDQWLNDLSRESKESLLVKLNSKLAAVEKRMEFLKMANNAHMGGVTGSSTRGKEVVMANQETYISGFDELWESVVAINGDQLENTSTAYNQGTEIHMEAEFLKMVNNGHGVVGEEVVGANQETHNSDFAINGDQLSRGKEVVGANQEDYNADFDEFWGSAFATNDDQLGNSSAYNQEREIVMAAEFWGSGGTNGDQLRNCSVYDQGQEVGFMGQEGQLMVMSNEINMWENFGWDDVWSIMNGPGPEFDLLPQGATGFGTVLNQQTLANDSSKPNYDYSIPLSTYSF